MTKILIDKETMKQALEALEALKSIDDAMPFPVAKHAMQRLRQALEQSTEQIQPSVYSNTHQQSTEQERKEFAVHAVDIARRAVAEEREACAKLVDYWEARQGEHSDAIRARGEA